jgi:hypothetical protein
VTEAGTVAKSAWRHYGPFNAATGEFKAVMTGTGDADLYVRRGSQPTTSAYDCRPYANGTSETCTVQLTANTNVYVSVRGYATTSSYNLTMTYRSPSTPPQGEWPNATSKANSDPHHSEIRVMRPDFALNFTPSP